MKLVGEKVVLRPIVLSDALRFVRWSNDPAVHRFLSRRKLTLKEECAWIHSIPRKKDELHFAIDTRDGVHIGSVGLNEIDRRDSFAAIGIVIGDERWWGRGYGKEAMALVLDYGFRRLKLHRIELEVYDYNVRGIKLYRSLGFKVEGKERERVRWGGRYHDLFRMGLLRREWLLRML